jgi:hypothetical protein
MADVIAEKLADQECRVSPAWVPRAEHPGHERAGNPRTLRPSGNRHALPNRYLAISARVLPRPPSGEAHRVTGVRARAMHARLSRHRQAGNARQRSPSVAVRETADGAHRPSWWPRFPSAMRPWTPQHSDPQRDKVIHAETVTKRPASAHTCS